MTPERARTRRRPIGVIAAILAVVATAGISWRATADTSLPAPGWQATVTPNSALLDGDTVALNVKANADVNIYSLEVRQCRFGPTYAAPIDMSPRGGNCPSAPISSSADLVLAKSASDGLLTLTKSAAGATVNYHVGSGTTNWDTPTGPASLTCDITTPCALVVKFEVGADVIFKVFELTFTDADPIVACGGTAPGVLHAAAADELADAWAKWTRSYCAEHPGGAPSSTAFPGEGNAVNGFLAGGAIPSDLDVAYGSAGIDPGTGMILSSTPARKTIAVPIALNAAVLGVGGGHRIFIGGQPGDKQPYPSVQMSVSDAAALLAQGIISLQTPGLPYKDSILLNNLGLGGIAYWTGSNVLASSLALTSTWLTTSYFTKVTPLDWVNRRDSPTSVRGASASLASASPPFTDITLLTGRPAMGKVALSASLNDPDGPLWVFTDRATAMSLKLTSAALQNPAGTSFVEPTPGSMAAAVANMKPNAQGVMTPQIAAATAAIGVGTAVTEPYPLTYVEYAFVPAEQLVDPITCAARTSSQTLLKNWLEYVTGTGQSNLAVGLEPLTDALKTHATDAIAKIGTVPTTGPCAGKVTPEGAPGGAAPGGATGTPASGPAFSSTLPTAALTAPGGAAAAAAAAADAGAANKKSAAVAVPAFAGHQIADPVGGVVALLGIVLVMSLAAWITAGGSLSGGGQWTPGSLGALTPRRVGSLALLWGGVGVAGLGLVLFQLGPLLEQRDQRSLLSDYRQQVDRATHETQGLGGVTVSSKAPDRGSPVGILEVGAVRAQDVVVEGVEASQTRQGPGHVPGTAGLGQPGNAVVVARRNGYGGSFAGIGSLRKGDRVVVTTTQGQSVYAVAKVCDQSVAVDDPAKDSSSTSSLPSSSASSTAQYPCEAPRKPSAATGTATAAAPDGSTTTTAPGATTTTVAGGSGYAAPAAATKSAGGASLTRTKTKVTIKADDLYGPSKDDRLTLVTSGEKAPWNSSQATIVVAKLLTKPFEPTTQGTRVAGETGFSGDSGAWSTVILVLMGFVGVIVASVALYRKMRFRVAYVLTIAPLVALTIIAGETLARLLPAWT